MKRRGWSRLAGTAAGVSLAAWTGAAAASSGIDSPDSGVVQMGRGSAWLARADDPLAAFFNPAAMAFQATSVHAGVQLMMANRCFTRLGPDGNPVSPDPVAGIPAPVTPGHPYVPMGQGDPTAPPNDTVCAANKIFPNPQLGAVFRVADRFAIGLALVAPHASGANTWPESLPYTNSFNLPSTEPSPQRYMLVNSNALIVFPTLSVAYAPLDNLSFGAGFVWGIGTVDFTTFSEALSPKPLPGMMPNTVGQDHAATGIGDVKARLTAKDMFIPGVILSALWMPTSNLDVAAWYKWSDALKGDTNLLLTSSYWNSNGALNTTPCPSPSVACNLSRNAPNTAAGTIKFQIPMEAKLGLRFHLPRKSIEKQPGWASAPGRKVRDPLSQDIFDVEVDFTWANNSAVQDIVLSFNQPGIPLEPPPGNVPANGNIPHNWKDVVGIRLGGDVAVVPNVLSLRAGAFFETKGQDDQYLNMDFDPAQKIGLSGGATVRVGPVDLSVGYQHTFYGTLNNGGNGSIYALSGDKSGLSLPAGMPACGPNMNSPQFGQGCFRSWQPINGGSLTAYLNEVGFSGTARF